MTSSEITPLKLWFKDFLKIHQNRYRHIKILSAWEEIVGHKLAALTQAKKIYQETLIVEVREKEWQVELFYYVGDILKKYKKQFPDIQIKKIYFKYNPYLETPLKKRKEISTSSAPSVPMISEERKKNEEATPKKITQSVSRLKQLWEAVNHDRQKTSLDENLKEQQEIKQKTSQNILTNSDSVRRTSNRSNSIEKFYSLTQIHSEFFKNQDEFQPFDLY